MFGIGMGEFILILIVGLIIFGPKNLPEVGKTLGKGLREFRKAQAALSATLEESANETVKNSAEEVKPAEKISVEKKQATVDDVINAAKENPIPKELYTGTKTDGAEKISIEKKSEPARTAADNAINAAKENPAVKEEKTN